MKLALASYKLRFFESHVRAVPSRDAEGCAFAGPGVDLRGEDARAVLEHAGPIRAWLEAREPGVVLRSFSADLPRQRVLVTLEPEASDRPRVLRFDPPSSTELLEAAAPLESALRDACARTLAKRAAQGSSGVAKR